MNFRVRLGAFGACILTQRLVELFIPLAHLLDPHWIEPQHSSLAVIEIEALREWALIVHPGSLSTVKIYLLSHFFNFIYVVIQIFDCPEMLLNHRCKCELSLPKCPMVPHDFIPCLGPQFSLSTRGFLMFFAAHTTASSFSTPSICLILSAIYI